MNIHITYTLHNHILVIRASSMLRGCKTRAIIKAQREPTTVYIVQKTFLYIVLPALALFKITLLPTGLHLLFTAGYIYTMLVNTRLFFVYAQCVTFAIYSTNIVNAFFPAYSLHVLFRCNSISTNFMLKNVKKRHIYEGSSR